MEQNAILKKIKCTAFDEIIREYQFNYFYDGYLSKLTEIVEFGQNGIRYNSTVVEWDGNTKTGKEYSPTLGSSGAPYPLYADFNGDGITDFMWYYEKANYTTNDYAFLRFFDGNSGFLPESYSIPLEAGFHKFISGDFDGDGKADLVRVRKMSSNSYQYTYLFSTNDWWGGSFTLSSDEVFVGDFDGNGKHDILTTSNTLYKDGAVTPTTITGITWGGATVADFNGNGKSNLLVTSTSGFKIYELNGTAFSSIISSSEVISNSTNKFLLGDFNGDGKTDILVKQGSTYFILFSTGTGFEKKTLPNLNVAEWYAGDFNRDGKTDIVFTQSNPFALKLGLFDGNTFQIENHTSLHINATNADKLSVADFDGDGFPEVFLQVTPNFLAMKSFNSSQKLFVKTIVNGLNQKTTFTYNPITNNTYYGASTTTYNFPTNTLQPPLYVVTQMSRLLTPTITDTETYYYKGARSHRQGKGFLGFEEITVTNANQDRKTTTKYGYTPTIYNVYPTQQTVKTTSGAAISQTDFTNNYYVVSTSPKVIFPYVSSQKTTDNLTGIAKTTAYTYTSANDGNPTVITETQGNLITTTNYTWAATQNSTYKNRVTQQVTSHSGSGQTFTETKKFTYDTKARLTQKIDFDNTKPVTTTYSDFDNFGNPQTIATSAANCQTCPPKTTTATFDATGRFPVTSTDVLGNTSSAIYDSKTGAVMAQIDIAGQITTHQYNGFGQRTQTTTPVGTTNYALAWDISNGNLYKSTVTPPVGGAQTTWYNAAGMETKRQVPGFSNPIITENEYNTKGQLTKSYLPNYSTKGGQYVSYTYDTYGRLATENNIGRTTTYTYSGFTTSVKTPDNQTRSTTLNSSGLVVNSTDGGGTITYTYNSLGKPESIKAIDNNAITTITYDSRGFQQSLKDPNLTKAIQYEYDAYGQLIKQINARDDITTYLYDVAGRITTETILTGRTLTYQYETLGGGIGQIKSISDVSGIVRSYSYNSLGQPLTVTEKIGNDSYTTTYTYNSANGQMLTKQSPSGLKIKYGYDTNGFFNSLKNAANDAPIWTLNTMNALGQITQSTQGNGLIRSVQYDATYHLPTQILLKNVTTNQDVDKMTYSFNGITGNLTSRTDHTNGGGNEAFEYDNLNRLKKIGNGVIQYADNGNILDKFNVGAYQYNGKPHAVSGITLNPTTAQAGMTHDITNTSYNRVSKIEQQGVKKVEFTYNPDNQRNKATYYEGTTTPLPLKKTTYYVGNYEKIVNVGGTTEENDYIYTPDGMSAIAKKIGGVTTFYYVNTDHLGSIRTITKADKTLETRYIYDAWGVQDKKTNAPSITNRGYTGHEHLPDFGLINMNARMYDPVLGRFLEVDPYVAMSDYSQGYNRYAYAMNNPLIYTDPSGEWIFTAIGIVAVLAINYFVAARNNTPVGENQGDTDNWAFNPKDWGKDGTPGFMITAGYNPGGGDISLSATVFNNGHQITAGVSKGDNYFSLGGGYKYNGIGASYYWTNFGGDIGYDGYSNRQAVGEIGLYYGDISVRLANDFLAFQGRDRWRSNALEIAIGNFTVGTFLYNNNPAGEAPTKVWTRDGIEEELPMYYEQYNPGAVNRSGNFNNCRTIIPHKQHSAWINGKTYTSPLYIGYRNGSYAMRAGYSHPAFQDKTQNFVHRNGFLGAPFGYQHFYNDYSAFQRGGYFYSGYHNPYSLYTR